MSADGEMSKSAKARARKKAAAAAAAAEAAPPAPAPKAEAPKAKAKGKAEAKPKAAEPKKEAAPEPKAKAKGKAEPKQAAAKPAAAKPEPKAKGEPKAKSKAAAKAKAKEPEPEEKEDRAGPLVYYEIDDGSRKDDWEVSTGKTKHQERRQKVQEEKKDMAKAAKSGEILQAKGNQHIPGLAPASVQIAQAKGKAGAKAKAAQSVTAVVDVSAIAAAQKDKEPERAAAPDIHTSSVSIKVPENKIGWIVGPKGANINLIKDKTGIKTLDMAGDECTLIGTAEAVAMAEIAVNQLLEKGYCSLQYDDYEEDGVMCHPTVFPDLIGKGGVVIQEIKKQAKCEVSIPPVPKNGPAGKKYRVGLAGSKASVALGKEIVASIMMYGHHELIHPGQSHKELEIEAWRYPFLIGSKGSELRHIQNNYKVKVNIPREHSACQNVVIVGEPRGIEGAEKYIEKVLYDAEQPRGRGAQEKAVDDWGDEGEVEDWMKPYMYQRR